MQGESIKPDATSPSNADASQRAAFRQLSGNAIREAKAVRRGTSVIAFVTDPACYKIKRLRGLRTRRTQAWP
jgi:hypothetical protein